MNKPEFDFAKLNYYFYKGVIDYDPVSKQEISFHNDVLYDENQNFWKQNCVKYEMVDDIKLINHFKQNFSENTSLLSSVVKGRIIEAYRQYGRQKFENLLEVPGKSVVFQNYLIYLGKDINRIIDTDKFQDQVIDNNKVIQPYSLFFITNPIPYNYISDDTDLKCPTIDKYFSDWVGEDKKDLLYELIGYCMLPEYPLHRIFLLFGSGRNGKSKFLNILERVIGKENTTASDLHTLTEDRFGTAGLYKKLVCFISETDYHKLDRTSILKRLSGEDPVNAQFKNKPAFTFNNYAKIIIATNTIPQMQDKTYGNMARYVIIDFPNRFSEQEDILEKIPEAEYEALANICVRKLEVLLHRRKFYKEPSPEDKFKIYEEKSNPLGKFIELYCNTNTDEDISKFEFEERYTAWLKDNGYSVNFSKSWLSSELEEKGFPKTRKHKKRFGSDTHYYYFDNISWKNTVPEIKIEDDKEYTKEEIFEHFVNLGKIHKDYNIDEAIRILKTKAELIYEPKNGIYKINKGVVNVNKMD